jgi:gamma-glutamylcyclotransferase (GGCT)/AIG2-like uncharacterized protein YtfP
MKYFAYGSNMSAAVMLAVAPGHRFLGAARLQGHRLAFTRRSIRTGSGVADMVADPGAEIWGALYEVPHGELEAVDRKEGVGFAYARTDVLVYSLEGHALTAIAYAVAAKEPVEIAPSADYLNGIVRAAAERSLPEDYVRSLHALLPGAIGRKETSRPAPPSTPRPRPP